MLQEPEGVSSDQGEARKTSCGMSVKGSQSFPQGVFCRRKEHGGRAQRQVCGQGLCEGRAGAEGTNRHVETSMWS